MTTSSTRLRMGAAVAITTLGLFSLGGSALAGEGNGQGAEHRNDRAGAAKAAPADETTDDTTGDGDKPSPQEAKAAQFEADQAEYDGTSSRHPSGKDRTEEAGGSGDQGQSTSDPDGDLNGGADKPNGPGGLSTLDQDGNNGCGNDQDFEDDNNGWCGRKPMKAKEAPVTTPDEVEGDNQERCPKEGELAAGETMPKECEEITEEKTTGGTLTGGTVAPGAVLGAQLQHEAGGEVADARVLGVVVERAAPAEAAPATSVLGASLTRGGVLARTGFGLTLVGLLGLALVLVGAGLQRAGRREHGPLA